MRTHFCGEVTERLDGEPVAVCGWLHRRRDHGGVIFIDLRDRSGLLQVVIDPDTPEAFALADRARSEYVLRVEGRVRFRPEGTENPELATGRVEVLAKTIEVLNESRTPPFQLDDEGVNEETRLRYRYVDLRRPRMHENLRLRSEVTRIVRAYLDSHGFLDVETPMLTKATPEGARDYLVPSRTQPGRFFALPQSPQLFKQLLMMSGVERYYQIVRCFRDEDLRADRQPEFTQIDIETSFLEMDRFLTLMEGMVRDLFARAADVEFPDPLPRLTWSEAVERFGTDRPDLRIGLELVEVADLVRDSEFKVFAGPARNPRGRVAALRVPAGGVIPRSRIDGYTEFVAQYGAKGLAWIRVNDARAGREGLQSPIVKFLDDAAVAGIVERTGAEDGDLIFFGADVARVVNDSLGALRVRLGRDEGLVRDGWEALWVVEFPMFEWDEREKRWSPLHHPFTAPATDDPETLRFAPGDCLSKGLRPRRQRPRARRRLGADPPPGDAAGRVPGARDRGGGGGGEVRLPPRIAPVRVPAARRNRVRARPHGDAARGRGFHPRRDRVPQDPDRALPPDRRPHRRIAGPAPRARYPRPHPRLRLRCGRSLRPFCLNPDSNSRVPSRFPSSRRAESMKAGRGVSSRRAEIARGRLGR